jgi:hypothetical protein
MSYPIRFFFKIRNQKTYADHIMFIIYNRIIMIIMYDDHDDHNDHNDDNVIFI